MKFTASSELTQFINDFFSIFTNKSFRGKTFLEYLNTPKSKRGNDEAPIVDSVISAQILGLLGFNEGDRYYNQQRHFNRPDFAPYDEIYETCFIIEDKNTALELNLDSTDPESHFAQLLRYVKGKNTKHGILSNGRRLMAWDCYDTENPRSIFDLDVANAIVEYQNNGDNLDEDSSSLKALTDLYEFFRKDSFSQTSRLEQEIAISLEEWEQQALRLGKNDRKTALVTDVNEENRELSDLESKSAEDVLVDYVQTLIRDLQRDARKQLDRHLDGYKVFERLSMYFTDEDTIPAADAIESAKHNFQMELGTVKGTFGLTDDEIQQIELLLATFERDAKKYISHQTLAADIFEVINRAYLRLHEGHHSAFKKYKNLAEISLLDLPLQSYSEKVFSLHRHRAVLRQRHRANIAVHDDFTIWMSLVEETMLGELSEEERRDEFALQAVYVVFIRLLLIRVCEDKGIFPDRFLSDGGMSNWQSVISRYLKFADGNPYSSLLDMAYQNAQNIYAHFFTGRELFNWYTLDKKHFLIILHRLNRFNFAAVDSDIIGTIYSTYLTRREKKKRGQFYTPSEIVEYILDHVGYVTDGHIVGSDRRLIDPACGSGKFLVKAAKRLVEKYRQTSEDPLLILKKVTGSIYGFDLNPFACYLAEVNLLIQVLDLVKLAIDRGSPPRLERFNVYNVDSLARQNEKQHLALFETLLGDENDIIADIKNREPGTQYQNGFAFVVGNPPFGAELSESYKKVLKKAWSDVFHGQPDTYVFFFKFALELLADEGRLGYIVPNTFLAGKNTRALRKNLLEAGVINEIVDLPQGIWDDATVDCVLLFLQSEKDENIRADNNIEIKLAHLKGKLDSLASNSWLEQLTQSQKAWLTHPTNEFNIRHDELSEQIENACMIGNNSQAKVWRLENVTESSQGIIVYGTKVESDANAYIKEESDIPPGEINWKPLLDTNSSVGRYELKWGNKRNFVKYESGLHRARAEKFFEEPKLILNRLRNKSLKRRLVATYDESQFYNRDNFSNIIIADENYDLKYILALLNSSLLNYWYARKFDNVNINPDYFRKLPIYPAASGKQAEIAALVTELLVAKSMINDFREKDYVINYKRDGTLIIRVPYAVILTRIRDEKISYRTLDLADAQAMKQIEIPKECDLSVTISGNLFVSTKYPTNLVLRNNKLWIEIGDERLRIYLLRYLAQPQFQGKTWSEIETAGVVPADSKSLTTFFNLYDEEIRTVETKLERISQLDRQIDESVLDLYGITEQGDRTKILNTLKTTSEESDSEETEVEKEEI